MALWRSTKLKKTQKQCEKYTNVCESWQFKNFWIFLDNKTNLMLLKFALQKLLVIFHKIKKTGEIVFRVLKFCLTQL